MVVSMYDSLAKQNNPTVTKVPGRIVLGVRIRTSNCTCRKSIPMVTSSYDALAKLNNSKTKS